MDDVVDFLCKIGVHSDILYLWRPVVRDPHDNMILEMAVAANYQTVVTYNKKDFQGVDRFGVRVETAYEFLKRIGELK